MTPSELQLAIGPVLARMKPGRCLCSNRSFRKTISFDFRDYDISPTALADSEILISNRANGGEALIVGSAMPLEGETQIQQRIFHQFPLLH